MLSKSFNFEIIPIEYFFMYEKGIGRLNYYIYLINSY